MKRALLALSFAAVVAGTASAAVFAPAEYEPAMPKLVKPPQVPPRPSAPIAIEARRAPVPVLPVAKRTYVPMVAVEDVLGSTATGPSENGPSVAELAAKTAIEADGYKNVRVVGQEADGRWTARATRGSTEVGLTVEPDGSVRLD
jgi:hypothetical protein